MKGFINSHSFLILSATIFLTCFTSFGYAGVQLRKENLSVTGCNKEIEISNGFPTFVENEEDDIVLFECLTGFLPYGGMKATCKNQEWSALPPKCIKKGCPQLKIPINGHFEEIEDFSGALVHFQCDQGYQLMGQSEITCDGGEKWSHEPPTCVKLPRQVIEQTKATSQ